MNIGKSRKTSDLAALDGATFGLDKAMTMVSFVLLFVIVFIPIFMIVYNAFFFEGKFDIEMFQTVVFSKDNVDAMTNTVIIGFAVTIFGTIVGRHHRRLVLRLAAGPQRHSLQRPHAGPVYDSLHVPPILRGHGLGHAAVRTRRLR